MILMRHESWARCRTGNWLLYYSRTNAFTRPISRYGKHTLTLYHCGNVSTASTYYRPWRYR